MWLVENGKLANSMWLALYFYWTVLVHGMESCHCDRYSFSQFPFSNIRYAQGSALDALKKKSLWPWPEVQSPVRAHAWVLGLVPSRLACKRQCINVSLLLFLPPFPSLSRNNKMKKIPLGNNPGPSGDSISMVPVPRMRQRHCTPTVFVLRTGPGGFIHAAKACCTKCPSASLIPLRVDSRREGKLRPARMRMRERRLPKWVIFALVPAQPSACEP